VTVAPVRSAMARCAGGGIIRSSVATRYQLGLIRQEASLIVPPSAFTPQGTWESAMNAARSAGRSAANDVADLADAPERRKPVTELLVAVRRVYRRLDDARRDGVDPDAAGGVLDGE
jgi:hypothetical protein